MSGRAPRRKGDKTARRKQVVKPYEPKPEERACHGRGGPVALPSGSMP